MSQTCLCACGTVVQLAGSGTGGQVRCPACHALVSGAGAGTAVRHPSADTAALNRGKVARKHCEHCQRLIPETATICPVCHQDQGSAARRRALILGIAAAAFGTAALLLSAATWYFPNEVGYRRPSVLLLAVLAAACAGATRLRLGPGWKISRLRDGVRVTPAALCGGAASVVAVLLTVAGIVVDAVRLEAASERMASAEAAEHAAAPAGAARQIINSKPAPKSLPAPPARSH